MLFLPAHSAPYTFMNTVELTKQEIQSILLHHQASFRSLGVKRLGLFGSFVRGEQTPRSDIDLLVEFEQGQKSFDHFMQLAFPLGKVLERHVEFVTIESLSPYIGPHILKEVEYVSLAA